MSPVGRAVLLAIAAIGLASLGGCDWPPKGVTSTSSSTPPPTTPSGDAPVIDAVNMTASASADSGFYTIFGTISYECDDDVVHTIRIYVPVLGKSYDYAAGDQAQAIAQQFSFQLSDDAPLTSAGDTNYTVTVITKGGVKSAPIPKTVTLL